MYADNRKAFNLAHNPKLGFQAVKKKRREKKPFFIICRWSCEGVRMMRVDGFTWLDTKGFADRRAPNRWKRFRKKKLNRSTEGKKSNQNKQTDRSETKNVFKVRWKSIVSKLVCDLCNGETFSWVILRNSPSSTLSCHLEPLCKPAPSPSDCSCCRMPSPLTFVVVDDVLCVYLE